MANPCFIYWPEGHTSRRILDLGEDISDLQQTPRRRVLDSGSLSGKYTRTNLTSGLSIRIVDERFSDRRKFRQLHQVINHAETGLLVAFAVDSSKIYGYPIRETSTTGAVGTISSTIKISKTNWFVGWHTAPGTIAVGDEICIESGAWRGYREWHKVDQITDAGDHYVIRTQDKITHDYSVGGIVRYADFFPFLRLPENAVGGNLISHEHRISFTFDCPFDLLVHYIDVVIDNPHDENVGNPPNRQNPDKYFQARMAKAPFTSASNTFRNGVGSVFFQS